MAFLLIANLFGYIHFMTHVRTSPKELNGKYAFFATYLLYIYIEGVLAPIVVVSSVQKLSDYSKQHCRDIFEQAKEIFRPKRKNKVCPEMTAKKHIVLETNMKTLEEKA